MRNQSIPALLTRITGRALLATPEMIRQYVGVLAEKRGFTGVLRDTVAGVEHDLTQLTAVGTYNGSENKIFQTVPGEGIAVIALDGGLVHKAGYVGAWSGMTGYDGIEAQLQAARNDASIKAIMIDSHSCGGEVSGCFDVADLIRVIREEKPVWALADEVAYSAAYALVSQASRVITPRTGGVGSVGAYWMHANFAKYLENEGIEITLVSAGERKVDGNPYEALPKDVQATVKKELEAARLLFAEIVAAGCGIKVADVLATEAACLTATEALDVGFIDAIMPARDAYAELAEYISGTESSVSGQAAQAASTAKENQPMARRNGAASSSASSTKVKTSKKAEGADDDKKKDDAVAEGDEGGEPADDKDKDDQAAAEDAGDEEETDEPADESAKAAGAERKRIAGIMKSPHAKGRGPLAEHLAYQTTMSVKEAEALMAAAPKEGQGSLAATMAAIPNAQVGDGVGAAVDGDEVSKLAASIRSAGRAARGEKSKAA